MLDNRSPLMKRLAEIMPKKPVPPLLAVTRQPVTRLAAMEPALAPTVPLPLAVTRLAVMEPALAPTAPLPLAVTRPGMPAPAPTACAAPPRPWRLLLEPQSWGCPPQGHLRARMWGWRQRWRGLAAGMGKHGWYR